MDMTKTRMLGLQARQLAEYLELAAGSPGEVSECAFYDHMESALGCMTRAVAELKDSKPKFYNMVLTALGAGPPNMNKIATIKAVRTVADMPLKDAKDLCDQVETGGKVVVKRALSMAEFNRLRVHFVQVGAVVVAEEVDAIADDRAHVASLASRFLTNLSEDEVK